jgi:hypothetical protein
VMQYQRSKACPVPLRLATSTTLAEFGD